MYVDCWWSIIVLAKAREINFEIAQSTKPNKQTNKKPQNWVIKSISFDRRKYQFLIRNHGYSFNCLFITDIVYFYRPTAAGVYFRSKNPNSETLNRIIFVANITYLAFKCDNTKYNKNATESKEKSYQNAISQWKWSSASEGKKNDKLYWCFFYAGRASISESSKRKLSRYFFSLLQEFIFSKLVSVFLFPR